MSSSPARARTERSRSVSHTRRSSSRFGRLVARAAVATASVTCLGLVAGGALVVESASAVEFPLGSGMDPATVEAGAALDALRAGDQVAFVAALGPLADEIGRRVEIDPARLVAAWSAADHQSMTALLSALTQLGVSYRYATSKPGVSFDCSGLVKWAWSQAGVSLPSNSSAIIKSMPNTSTDELEPGDVMFYPGHVMLALGVDDAYVHAVGRGKPLEVRSMYSKHRNKIRAADPVG